MNSSVNRRHFAKILSGCIVASSFPSGVRATSNGVARFAWTNTGVVSSPTAHTLMRTNIPALNGLQIEMKQLNAAPAVAEALLSGSADIGSMSDFTCLTPIAVGAPLKVIAKQSTFRTSILSTSKTDIKTLSDLKGRTVYGVFGVTAYQNAQEAVQNAGLTPGRDVKFVNMDVAELADSVRAQRIDAFFTWDPWVAFFENAGHARILSQNITAANLLVARTDFIRDQFEVVKQFLRAHQEAQLFCSKNHKLVNNWFRSLDPARGIPEEVIETASQFNPDWNAPTLDAIKMSISADRLQKMQALAEWGKASGLLAKLPNLENGIDNRAAVMVDSDATSREFDLASVKVL